MLDSLDLELFKMKTRAEDEKKLSVPSQPYTETSLMRILIMLDQMVSLVKSSPEGFKVLKSLTKSANLQLLIEISVNSSIRNQTIV